LHEAIIALETIPQLGFWKERVVQRADMREILRSAGREESAEAIFGKDPKLMLDKLVMC